MSNIKQLENMPEFSFIENMTLKETESLILEEYLRIYKETNGKEAVLGKADPIYLTIKAFASVLYQIMQYIETKGRAEFLKTATDTALDSLGAIQGIARQPAKRALAMERFILSEVRSEYVAIPAGTRVKTQDGRYFNTLDYAEIPPGEMYADVEIQAEQAGIKNNGIPEGSIDTLVDPIPYISEVKNIKESSGGLDIEDDDSLTERIYLSPSRFSSAGPRDAYEYYVKEWRNDITDVQVINPSPCVVKIYAVLENGDLLSETERKNLETYINGEDMRPLCDFVTCEEPEEISYQISLTYWIANSDKKSAGTIQEQVKKAAEDYQKWQRKLGRDINPTELIMRIRQAGAKRTKVTLPKDISIEKTQLPKCSDAKVIYGGVEDD